MLLNAPTSTWQRWLLAWMAAVLMLGHAPPSFADVAYKICPDPGVCFTDKATKDRWAAEKSCKFLEDVCDKSATRDSAGAPEADRGFWGDLWSGIKGGLQYGYQFVKGVVAGLKDQVTGIVALLTNFDDVVAGLIHLGKSFYNDPKGTATKLAEVLGNEVVDTIIRASLCGPYDLGKVIGQNVSPVLVAKLAIKIARFSGDLRLAARATKLELGCASFEAGTPVLTPAGPVPIERIAVGQAVLSRSERGFADAPQSVAKTFNRSVDHVYSLVTEFETLSVSDEHPLWQQGKGWTPVRELKRGDIVATASGDVTVLTNERVDRATRVFNFSVNETPSYFVGEGVWAHNALCDLGKNWASLSSKEKGFRAEMETAARLEMKGYKRVGETFDPSKYPDTAAAIKAWDGQRGIDGIFVNAKGEYIFVESKGKGVTVKDEVAGCVDRLCPTKDHGRQMSEQWINDNLAKIVPNDAERTKIANGLRDGKIKRVYAQTDGGTTVFNEILTPAGNLGDAVIGAKWTP